MLCGDRSLQNTKETKVSTFQYSPTILYSCSLNRMDGDSNKRVHGKFGISFKSEGYTEFSSGSEGKAVFRGLSIPGAFRVLMELKT